MKKNKVLFFLLLIVVIFTMLSSCTVVGENDVETTDEKSQVSTDSGAVNNTSSDEFQTVPQETEDNIIEPGDGKGSAMYFNYDPELIPQELVFEPDTVLDETMPVYSYDYGYGEGGNFYTVGDAERAVLENKLDSFLSIRWGEGTKAEYTHNEYTVTCENENERIYSSVNSLTVSPLKNKVGIEEFSQDPLENEIVKDFVEFLELDEPSVICFDRTNSSSGIVEYYIAEHSNVGDDFKYIKVKFRTGEMVHCKSVEVNLGEKYGEYSTIPYNVALAQIKDEYPELDTDSAIAITYMGFEYQQVVGADGSYGGNGYYSPYYRFFLKSTDLSVEGYTMIDVSMTDFKPGETIVLE